MRRIAPCALRAWRLIRPALDSQGDGFTPRRGEAEMDVELIQVHGDEAEIRIDGRTHFVPFIVNGSEVSFAYDGEIWIVEVEEKGSRARARHRDHSMAAPMPGVV